MTTDINDKIADMEILIAHQDKQIQELNDIVTEQGNEMDALKKYVLMTKSKIQALEHNMSELGQSSEGISVTDEAAANKPPHY